MEDRYFSKEELRDRKAKELALKRKNLVEHHRRSVQVINCKKKENFPFPIQTLYEYLSHYVGT